MKTNLIALSGKKNSGKDTVGKIIQYLCYGCDVANISFDVWDGKPVWGTYETNFFIREYEIKKFAGKLKQMVALLIGCSVEDLEDEEFKNKPLGEEWWYYERLGKMESYLESKHFNYKTIPLIKPTPRLMLQLLGTEGMRDVIHPNVHVNALFADYNPTMFKAVFKDKEILRDGIYVNSEGNKETPSYPNWIITDVRFPNELEAIEKRGGLTIRVERPKPREDENGHQAHYIEHSSERALDNAKFDYVIHNNSNIEFLIEKVREILIKEEIING